MKQIPYSDQNTSKLFHEIKSYIEDFDTALEIDLTDTHQDAEGYKGNYIIEIDDSNKFFQVEDFSNNDLSRFPSRIKATATALKFSGYLGKFSISHEKGILKVERIDSEIVNQELNRRMNLWKEVSNFPEGEVHWKILEEKKVIAGERGIYRNKEKTKLISQGPDGVTVAIRHTEGRYKGKYPDELSDHGLIYRYPETSNLTMDQGEINATKECIELKLPIFIILKGKERSTKEVKLGWVVGFDDQEKHFNINFLKNTSIDLPTIKKERIDFGGDKKATLKPNYKNNKSILNCLTDPPESKPSKTKPVINWSNKKGAKKNYLEQHRKNEKLGLAGEIFIVNYEKMRLQDEGKPELADRVEHVSQTKGDGKGFDVLSFNKDGSERWIEVKTTNYGKSDPFLIEWTEVQCSIDNPKEFHLYRVFNFKNDPKLYILSGSVEDNFKLKPKTFSASR